MEWTDEKPNQEGYFWRLCGPVASVVHVKRKDGDLCYLMCFEHSKPYISKLSSVTNCLWAGPIPLPCEP